MCFAVPPEAPTLLNVTSTVGGIGLGWTNNALNNLTSITIQRSTTSAFTTFVTFTLPSVIATTYTDTTAVVGTPYYYRVIATNSVGIIMATGVPVTGYPSMNANSTPSNTVPATRTA
jgi:hypothetical protein